MNNLQRVAFWPYNAGCIPLPRIVQVPDDLSWALFAYSGAAAAAGQSYTGAPTAYDVQGTRAWGYGQQICLC